jgi:hypothetical protein
MLLAAKSWRLRQSARLALEAGDWERALTAATASEKAHHTRTGAFLRVFAAWLN